MDLISKYKVAETNDNPFWKPRPSSYFRVAFGTTITTVFGFTIKYVFRFFKDNPAILESQFENTISGIISNMRHTRFIKICVLLSAGYYTLHELIFHYCHNICGFTGNYWITHSIAGWMAYKQMNRITFNLKMGRLKSTKMYLLHFLIFNGMVEMFLRRQRFKLSMNLDEYRALGYHIGLRLEGETISQEYTEEEIQHLKECEDKVFQNIGGALSQVKMMYRK